MGKNKPSHEKLLKCRGAHACCADAIQKSIFNISTVRRFSSITIGNIHVCRTGKVSRAGGHGGHHDMPRVAGRGRNMMISSFPRRNLFGRCSGHAQRAVMNNDGGALGKVWDEVRGYFCAGYFLVLGT